VKAVILAGGLGTRLSEETTLKPKPMVEIGNKPIIWHIMKILSAHGVNEFIICCGYKGSSIKEYFENYSLSKGDILFNLQKNSSKIVSDNHKENWSVLCVETGENTLTGGRIKKIKKYLEPDEPFLLTYGDGVGNINITELVKFHEAQNKLATVTAVNPPSRFGVLSISKDNSVEAFNEKPKGGSTWINGGFFILDPSVIDYISSDLTAWEEEPVKKITEIGQMSAYKHDGFWQPMDTLNEKKYLNDLYAANNAPWVTWD
jgi:glucose-1-phosphate cytidylyltransferase